MLINIFKATKAKSSTTAASSERLLAISEAAFRFVRRNVKNKQTIIG